ncbi:protein Rf1, mitochondrial-like [Panicum miliaceum]|uniref:Protein Rf1, mitochondrial-like n=1 Tax=Panicum miliaceum TaxID=4540 RepID=A0A3L6Q2N2_PANMI|nr:protein Rf1, mitochondrial-like [Panicum miliaceum]
MSRRASAALGRCLELEHVITGRFRSRSLALDDAVKLFDELLHNARPASVRAFNQVLTAGSRAQRRGSSSSSLELVPSLFNRMARACSNKVAPDLHTYSILINCFCRMGRLELSFAAFGLVLKTGFRVNARVINPLLKGLCDRKRVHEAMDVLLRRMPEFGCTPDVFSYNIILKGFCNERRAEEALELLHMMADDGGGSCPPDVVSYNTVISGFFRDGQVDRAYNLFHEINQKCLLLANQ